jgi:hypothetical protein
VRAALALAKALDRRRVGGVAGELVAAQPLEGDDGALDAAVPTV